MRKIHIGVILSGIILFSYQNCSYPKEKSTPSENSNQISILANENVRSITFLSTENTVVQQNSKTFTLVSQNSYFVDYASGEITKSVQATSSNENYCLSESLLNELHDIISSSTVCKIENKQLDGQVCSQAYRYGYAQIQTGKETLDLGSGSDGCMTNKIDLCKQSSSDMLKGWFLAIKNQLSHLNCSQ